MNRIAIHLAGCLAAAALLATPAMAADATEIDVALLDMSALASGPMGPGFGAGSGYGMMGPGQGFGGPGYGMMGPGMMGGGGYGMMMGMMSIRADETTAKAGAVTFNVTNWSRSVVHEVVVIAVDSPGAPLPYDYARQIVPEAQVKMLGETDELEPNASGSLELTLPPGNYLLICNIPGHYAAGMALPFSVTE